jgi:hypothetical protein
VVIDAGCPLFGFRSVTQGGVNASGLRQITVEAEESPWRLEVRSEKEFLEYSLLSLTGRRALAIARSTSSLIGECYATRVVFKMATLSTRRFLILLFPS